MVSIETFEIGIRKTVQWYLDNPQWTENILNEIDKRTQNALQDQRALINEGQRYAKELKIKLKDVETKFRKEKLRNNGLEQQLLNIILVFPLKLDVS